MGSGFVGRSPERDLLNRVMLACAGGRGAVVLVSGEAGIGKTRLAEHTVALAGKRGFTVLTGQADPLHTGLAYAPMAAAMRRYLVTLSDAKAARLLAGLDGLGVLLSHPALPRPGAVTDPGLARTRMVDAARTLLTRLAAQAPTLLLLDDLHCADPGTVELLPHLGDTAAKHRLLVIGTYRDPVADGPLDRFARQTTQLPRGHHLPLRPLDPAEVADLAGRGPGGTQSPDTLHDLVIRSGGNPLFVTALTAGADPHGDVPAVVRDVVLGRLRELTEAQRALLELVAVCGDAGSDEVLTAAWADRLGDLGEPLAFLVRQGLVTGPPDAATYRLAHPLYAEVAYAELTDGERAVRHAVVAAAIELAGPADVRALAPHYLRGGARLPPARVVEVLTAAGDVAGEDAIDYLIAAVDLARTHCPHLVTDLLERLGQAQQWIGRPRDALANWSEALGTAQRHGDHYRQATLRARIAALRSECGDSPPETHADAGVQSAALSGDHVALLRWTLALRCRDADHVRQRCRRLEGLCRDYPSPDALCLHRLSLGLLALLDGDITGAERHLTSAYEQATQCTDTAPELGPAALRLLAGARVLAGDIAGALRCVDGGCADGDHAGPAPSLPGVPHSARLGYAMVRYFAGEPAAALADLQVAIASARRQGLRRQLPKMLAFSAFLHAEAGRPADAARDLAAAESDVDSPELGLTDLLATARSAIALADGSPAPPTAPQQPPSFVDPMADSLRLMVAGQVAVAARDLAAARQVARLLRAAGATAELCAALADQLEGNVAAMTGDRATAGELLHAAARRLHDMGAPLLAARARLASAQAGASIGDDEIAELLRTFAGSPAGGWLDRARKLARTRGVAVPAGAAVGALTARQADVVTLVGAGLSNTEIARRLMVSARTVESHLHDSYRRLGVTTRTALATWATTRLSAQHAVE
ncbi:MAG TPA: AAA family ATPase [Actinophytocola sp.]|jgi:DNA-binding NarL/FixJ family response regulator|nr:AAA family ATPase [Actinophytocola sp.]